MLEPQKVAPKAKSCPNVADQQQQTQQSFYSQYSEVQRRRKKMRIQETVLNEMIEIAFLLTIIVCNSQGSKAFELATAYVQVKKGPK